MFHSGAHDGSKLPRGFALKFVQGRADIDSNGSEFNFVLSIRVFEVRYARQHELARDGDCNRMAEVSLSTYASQGDFSWRRFSPGAPPRTYRKLFFERGQANFGNRLNCDRC